jgi:transposase
MRGRHDPQGSVFFAINLERLVPESHPLREIRRMANEELKRMEPLFEKAYSKTGRPSVPPEQLIKASLLQALYSIRSERQLCEQLAYNFLFRWFLGMHPDERVWDPSTFTIHRARFEEHGLMRAFFEGTVAVAIRAKAAQCEDFSVDGTLLQAWASMKSVRPKEETRSEDGPGDGNRWGAFGGEKRSNETHESKTDPQAKLARRGAGQETKLCHSMHFLMDHQEGLLMGLSVAEANGRAEREEAKKLLTRFESRHRRQAKRLVADKGYDDGGFLHEVEHDLGVVPMVAMRRGKIRARDDAGYARRLARERTRTPAFRARQRVRRRIERIIGWVKEVALLRRTRFVGR